MKRKQKRLGWLFALALACLLAGCSHHEDDDLREVPVTNNPTLIPKSTSGMGMPY